MLAVGPGHLKGLDLKSMKNSLIDEALTSGGERKCFFFFFFFTQVQTPVTLCSGELWSMEYLIEWFEKVTTAMYKGTSKKEAMYKERKWKCTTTSF